MPFWGEEMPGEQMPGEERPGEEMPSEERPVHLPRYMTNADFLSIFICFKH